MNLLRHLSALCLVMGLGFPTSHAADLTDHPGFIDLDGMSFLNGKLPSVEVTLNGPVLKMLLQLPAQYDKDGQVRELLKVVDQILVRIYALPADQADDTLAFISGTSDTLEQQSWQRIVRVREQDDASVDIHVKASEDGENLNGLVIMAIETNDADETEVVLVNIAGNFNPAYLANIGNQFDIDYLGDVQIP